VPEVAKVAKKVTVFQRTPHWILPRGDYEISSLRKALYRYSPFWQRYWRRRYVDSNESEFISSNYPEHEDNKKVQKKALDMMQKQLPNQPELWKKLTPNYPVGCKRLVVTNFFYPALNRPNVDLEVRPIHSIHGDAVNVVGTTGQVEDADPHYDLIVFATGFRTTEFLHPMKIFGRNGRPLHELWKDGAQAYLGSCANDMPNFGMVMGPNTGLLHNSFVLMIEAQSRYISGLIKPVLEARRQGGSLSLTPRAEKIEEFNAMLQNRLKDFGANSSQCDNWYKTKSGLVTNLWPGTVLEFQKLVENVDYTDYEAKGASKSVVQKQPSYKVGRVVEEGGLLERLSLAQALVLGTSAIVVGILVRRLLKTHT
jgi:putative intracellular protease/amidase